jgi:WD40 repeat protein
MSAEWKDSWVEAWEVNTGRRLASWVAHKGDIRSLAFTGDGKVVMTAGADKTVRFWDVATGKKLRQIDGVINKVGSLALSTDGKLLACIEMKDTPPRMIGGEQHLPSVALRDAGDGKILRRLEAPVTKYFDRTNGFLHVAFSPDGKAVAASGFEVDVHVWDVTTGAKRCRFATTTHQAALAFSPDGKALALASNVNGIHLHDAMTGKKLSRPRGLLVLPYGLQLTPDGTTLVTPGSLTSFILWDSATGKERRRLEWHGGRSLPGSRLSADGRTLLCIGSDWTIRVWEVETGKPRQLAIDPVGPSPHLLAVSPDGKAFALAGEETVVRVLDAVSGKPTHRLEVGPARVRGAEFLADGRSLVVWSGDRKARVWDLATGKEVRHVQFVEAPIRPAGRMRVAGADRIGGVANAYYKAGVSPDGRLIAFGSENGMIALHDLVAGHELRRIEGLTTRLNTLAFSPDGRTLAWSAEGDSKVRLLEVATGKERHVLAGHVSPVVGLCFSADGRTLASGSEDTTALVWDLSGARMLSRPADRPESLWQDLASDDAARAYAAVRRLAASGMADVLLRERVKPTPAADPKRLAKLIADLDGDTFAAREAAAKELEKLGDRAAGALRQALAAGPAPEPRRRAEVLLKRLANEARELGAERVRLVRALEALEQCGTEGARRLLEALAKGAPAAWLTEEAKAALRRLEARHGKGG